MESTSFVMTKEFERDFYETLISEQPNFAEALDCLGSWYTSNGHYEKGLEMDLRLVSIKPEDPYAWYNLACSHSCMGSLAEALNAIKRAVCCGYDDMEYMMKDEDLENLRETEEFKQFFVSLKKTEKEELWKV